MQERKLSNWLKSFMDYTSNLEAPALFRMWGGISAIAGALRGKVWFNMGHFEWRPNFYIIFVAPPGIATKSTSFGVGAKILAQVEGINFGPDSLTWQALTNYMAEHTEDVLIDDFRTPISCVTLPISELGTFLDPKNGEMIDVLVDLWDGRSSERPWVRRTKGGGEEVIPQPFINFIAGTTPGWIRERMTEYGITGGLSSRTVFVYADKKEKLVPYPFLTMNSVDEQLYKDLVHDLKEIANLVGPFSISAEAIEFGASSYISHWTDTPAHLQGERLGGYVARKQTHLHKLAMVISAAQRNSMLITAKDLKQAGQILTQAESDMHRVFSVISSGTESAQLEGKVLEVLNRHTEPVSQVELYQERLVMYMGYQDFDKAVSNLVAAGLASRSQMGNTYMIKSKQKQTFVKTEELNL